MQDFRMREESRQARSREIWRAEISRIRYTSWALRRIPRLFDSAAERTGLQIERSRCATDRPFSSEHA